MTAPRSPLGALHPSNLLTYASLLCGIAAIAASLDGGTGAAGALIALAVIFDTFDGRFARVFRRTEAERAIGVQLDSLSDAMAFGLAPAVCVAMLSRESSGPVWWLAAFVYAACAITRLAFYNVSHGQQDGFVGLPVPVAALIWATALLLSPDLRASPFIALATAAAMVLPLPVPRPRGVGLAIFACWPLAVIAAFLIQRTV